MRPDQEFAERHMSPQTKRFMHRGGWVFQLVGAIGFLVFGVVAFFQMIHTNPVVAIAVTGFGWTAAWLGFTTALRTRARRLQDYPNEM